MKPGLAAAIIICALAASAHAEYDAGLAALEKNKYQRAIAELEPVARAGDPRAQYVLGILHSHGIGMAPAPERAIEWLEKSAEAGFIAAQLELARLYETGHGVVRDDAKRAMWYERAAVLGDVGAQVVLADAYAAGQGVPRDLVTAYMWYEVASQYWGEMMDAPKQMIAAQMTPAEIESARKRAAETVARAAR